MPARRYPWFKFWPEAMRHEKVVLLSDSAFRTWIAAMAAGAEQSRRGRFGSLKHLVRVTGRPEEDVAELVASKLLDVDGASGEVFVHDWRDWQDRFPSDFSPRSVRNGSANAPRSLPPEARGKSTEEEREEDPTPRPPPPLRGEGERNPRRRRLVAGGESLNDEPSPEEVASAAPPSSEDRALWDRARAAATEGMLPSNAERINVLEIVGRAGNGGLLLRAPSGWSDAKRSEHIVRVALFNAGDADGERAFILTGGI